MQSYENFDIVSLSWGNISEDLDLHMALLEGSFPDGDAAHCELNKTNHKCSGSELNVHHEDNNGLTGVETISIYEYSDKFDYFMLYAVKCNCNGQFWNETNAEIQFVSSLEKTERVKVRQVVVI